MTELADVGDLCAAVRAGRAATAVLLDRYTPMVYRVVADLRLPPQVERADLIQEGLLALTRAAEKWRPDGGSKFTTYAYTCVSNAARRAAGREATRCLSLNREFVAGAGEALDLVPAQAVNDVPAEVRARVAGLPPVYRLVLTMHFGLDGPPAAVGEIAAASGLTPPQVRRAVAVALAQV